MIMGSSIQETKLTDASTPGTLEVNNNRKRNVDSYKLRGGRSYKEKSQANGTRSWSRFAEIAMHYYCFTLSRK